LISHYRSEGTFEMARFIGTKVKFGTDDGLEIPPTVLG